MRIQEFINRVKTAKENGSTQVRFDIRELDDVVYDLAQLLLTKKETGDTVIKVISGSKSFKD